MKNWDYFIVRMRLFVAFCGFWCVIAPFAVPESAHAQESWATMSSDAAKIKDSNGGEGAAATVADDFGGASSYQSGNPSEFGGADDDNFGVENEDIFGDNPLNSATPSNSPEEVSGSGANIGTNDFGAGENNAGNSVASPAQQNAGTFNFNNANTLNNQAPKANPGIVSDSATNAAAPAAPAATPGLVAPSAPAAAMPSAPVLDLSSVPPTEPPVDQPAPLAESAPDPGYVAPAIPLANDFSGAPPIPGTRRVIADGEAPIEYSVEPGDTLYDVCDQLLDEGGYWPKLWALNPEIKNPHFIYPGMKLKFYPGDDETVPFLEVVAEDDVVPMDKGPLQESELIAEEVPIRTDRQQGENGPPPELIRAEDLQVPQEILDMFVMVGGRYGGSSMTVTIPGFIFDEEKTPEGYVLGGREGRVAVSEGYKVIIEQSGSLAPGTTYTVLRPVGKVESTQGRDVGYRYVFVAHLKVIQIEEDVAVGTVTESRLGVQSDDIVVSYLSTSRTVDSLAKGPATPVDGEVLAFDERGQFLGREGGFVFVSKSGVSVGQYVPVYRGTDGFSRGLDQGSPRDLEPIGQIRIIDASGGAAVGIITESLTGIKIGDTLKR